MTACIKRSRVDVWVESQISFPEYESDEPAGKACKAALAVVDDARPRFVDGVPSSCALCGAPPNNPHAADCPLAAFDALVEEDRK